MRLYRRCMQIEHYFRDWKSHLGLRGLHLRVRKSERLQRLLRGLTLAYLMVLLWGRDPPDQRLRPLLEQTCRRPRHGANKAVSVLSTTLYLLTDPVGSNAPANAGC